MSRIYGKPLPEGAATVLLEIMDEAKVPSVQITSVARTPEDQARVMWENCSAELPPAMKVLYRDSAHRYTTLYKLPGQEVIKVFIANRPLGREKCIEAMTAEIYRQGPSKVSLHCAPAEGPEWVFDVAPSSIPALCQVKFLAAARRHPRVTKVLQPPADPAYHLQVLKNE